MEEWINTSAVTFSCFLCLSQFLFLSISFLVVSLAYFLLCLFVLVFCLSVSIPHFASHFLCLLFLSLRVSAVCSVLWRWCVCCVWAEWLVNWITILNMVPLCSCCWCVCLVLLHTGSHVSGTVLETMKSLMRRQMWHVRTVGCTCWVRWQAHLTALMLQAQAGGRVAPARTQFTSPHYTSPWPVWPALASATSHLPLMERRSLPWLWWWSDVSNKETFAFFISILL